MKARSPLVIALAVLLSSLWLCSRREVVGPPPTAREGDDSAVVHATHSAPLLPPQPLRHAVESTLAADGQKVAAEWWTLRLEVIDAQGLPAAGAEVLFLPPMPDAQSAAVDQQDWSDSEQALRQHGRSAIADARGRLELLVEPDSLVAARSADQEQYGEMWVYQPEAEDPPLRLLLADDVRLHLLVVDAEGNPVANLPITAESQRRSHRHLDQTDVAHLGYTDEKGRLVEAHLQQTIALPGHTESGELRLWVGTRIGSRFDSRRDTQSDATAVQTIPAAQLHGDLRPTIVHAACGCLELRVLDVDGNALDEEVLLTVGGDERPQRPLPWSDCQRFVRLPLGQPLHLRTRDDSAPAAFRREVTIAGPTRANEVLQFEFVIPARRFKFHATLLRSDGSPLAHQQTVLVLPQLANARLGSQTNREGQVHFGRVLVPPTTTQLARVELLLWRPGEQDRIVPIDRTFAPGEHDLGELIVEQVNSTAPLASIELRCAGKPLLGHARVVLGYDSDDRADVVRFDQLHVAIRRDGSRFEFFGPVPTVPMLLHCRADGCVPSRLLPLPLGARQVVDLQPAASVVVAIEAATLPLDEIQAQLVPSDGREPKADVFDNEQQTAAWSEVAPGGYSLRIVLGDRELFRSPPFSLQQGANRYPSDGSRIDLRGSAEVRLLTARSAVDGEPLYLDALQVAADAVALPEEDAQVICETWFVLHEPRRDLLVIAAGHVPIRVLTPAQDLSLVLQPTIELELVSTLDNEGEFDRIGGRLVHDAVTDALLRQFDKHHPHAAEFDVGDVELRFAPGSIVEFWLERDGQRSTPVRVTVGTFSPPPIRLR